MHYIESAVFLVARLLLCRGSYMYNVVLFCEWWSIIICMLPVTLLTHTCTCDSSKHFLYIYTTQYLCPKVNRIIRCVNTHAHTHYRSKHEIGTYTSLSAVNLQTVTACCFVLLLVNSTHLLNAQLHCFHYGAKQTCIHIRQL